MKFSIISTAEKELLHKIEQSNDSELKLWKVSNIAIPLFTLLLSLASYTFFKSNNRPIEFLSYCNLLLNGAIPMIALNRIGGLGMYLFKYDKSKEKEFGIADTFFLRTKLFFWFLLILILTMCLYLYQVSNNPFKLSYWLIIPLTLSIISVIFSIKVAKHVYLLQETMMENSFYNKLNTESLETQSHLNKKYGNAK